MKTKEMFVIFALTTALSLASASTPSRPAGHTIGASPSSPLALMAKGSGLPALSLLQEQAPPVQPAPEKKDVDVTVKTETKEWYVSPVWVAIGILGAIVLVLLIGLAVRGAGSTDTTRIVHD